MTIERRLAELEAKVDRNSSNIASLSAIADQFVQTQRDLRREMERREDREVERFSELREWADGRFDRIDGAHDTMQEAAGSLDFKTWLGFIATVVVPIVVAIIATGGLEK